MVRPNRSRKEGKVSACWEQLNDSKGPKGADLLQRLDDVNGAGTLVEQRRVPAKRVSRQNRLTCAFPGPHPVQSSYHPSNKAVRFSYSQIPSSQLGIEESRAGGPFKAIQTVSSFVQMCLLLANFVSSFVRMCVFCRIFLTFAGAGRDVHVRDLLGWSLSSSGSGWARSCRPRSPSPCAEPVSSFL